MIQQPYMPSFAQMLGDQMAQEAIERALNGQANIAEELKTLEALKKVTKDTAGPSVQRQKVEPILRRGIYMAGQLTQTSVERLSDLLLDDYRKHDNTIIKIAAPDANVVDVHSNRIDVLNIVKKLPAPISEGSNKFTKGNNTINFPKLAHVYDAAVYGPVQRAQVNGMFNWEGNDKNPSLANLARELGMQPPTSNFKPITFDRIKKIQRILLVQLGIKDASAPVKVDHLEILGQSSSNPSYKDLSGSDWKYLVEHYKRTGQKLFENTDACNQDPASTSAVDRLMNFISEYETKWASVTASKDVSEYYQWIDKQLLEIHGQTEEFKALGETRKNQKIRELWFSNENLHMNNMLQKLFGMPQNCAAALLEVHDPVPTKEKTTEQLKKNVHRWLSKIFDGTEGCLGDVVNLCIAMVNPEQAMHQPSAGSDEWDQAQKKVNRALTGDKEALAKLWLPPTFVMDSELDDRLAMVLLVRLRQLRKDKLQIPTNPLRVIVQVGTTGDFTGVEDKMFKKMKEVEELMTFEIMPDERSRNHKAVREQLDLKRLEK
jgi:hypothetical protein